MYRRKLYKVVVAAVVVMACDDDPRAPEPLVTLSETPTDVPFRAVVEAVAKERGDGTLLVDPRLASGRGYANVPRATDVMEERARILHELRIPQTQAFPMPEGCDGYLAPPPARDVSGCPEASETVLAVGEIESGEEGEWVVPITVIEYSDGGFSGESADVILRRTSLGWEAVQITNSIVWE